jgi:hypothetical protein
MLLQASFVFWAERSIQVLQIRPNQIQDPFPLFHELRAHPKQALIHSLGIIFARDGVIGAVIGEGVDYLHSASWSALDAEVKGRERGLVSMDLSDPPIDGDPAAPPAKGATKEDLKELTFQERAAGQEVADSLRVAVSGTFRR